MARALFLRLLRRLVLSAALCFFCGQHWLVSFLRPGNIAVAKQARAILKLLVVRLGAVWPGVKITLRADSGFCRWGMLRCCERHRFTDVVVLGKTPRLVALAGGPLQAAAWRFN